VVLIGRREYKCCVCEEGEVLRREEEEEEEENAFVMKLEGRRRRQ
jgi:hypothetical protein